MMGQGDMGQLGLGEDIVEQKKPHPVGGVLEGSEVIQVVCGGMHIVVLTKDGTDSCFCSAMLHRTHTVSCLFF